MRVFPFCWPRRCVLHENTMRKAFYWLYLADFEYNIQSGSHICGQIPTQGKHLAAKTIFCQADSWMNIVYVLWPFSTWTIKTNLSWGWWIPMLRSITKFYPQKTTLEKPFVYKLGQRTASVPITSTLPSDDGTQFGTCLVANWSAFGGTVSPLKLLTASKHPGEHFYSMIDLGLTHYVCE